MWTVIANVAWGLIKFLMARSTRKDKAEQQFTKIIKQMDEFAKADIEINKKYEQMKQELVDKRKKEEEELKNPPA